MNGIYRMSKQMYDTIRFPLKWNRKTKKMEKIANPLSEKEVCDYINENFGLRIKIEEIELV